MKLTRRIVLTGFMAMFVTASLPKMLVLGQENESVEIEWRVPTEQLEAVKEQIGNNITVEPDLRTIPDSKGLPTIYILAAAAVILEQLAKALLATYRQVKYGGIVITYENDKFNIVNDPRLSSGTILFMRKDKDPIMLQEKDNPQPNQVVELLKLLLPQ